MMIDNCAVAVTNGELPAEELACYVQRGREKYGRRLEGLNIKVDGDFVDISYKLTRMPFQRIRRITGYLVGSLENFNDGKRAEEGDRVKHDA